MIALRLAPLSLAAALLCGCALPPAPDSRAVLPEYRAESLTPDQAAALVRFAPVIFQETSGDPADEHRDFITTFDYDGNRVGNDNEESLAGVTPGDLTATVYYALVETDTHRFMTYFLYHPLDWAGIPNLLWLGIWHENDGESVQVVTRKATATEDEKVVLVATQAHLFTHLYGEESRYPARGSWSVEDGIRLVYETHPAVFVESGGHGIYGLDEHPEHGLVFEPGSLTEGDVWTPGCGSYRYRLVPIHDTLWRAYRRGEDQGDGALLDGRFDYRDDGVVYRDLPRHFDSDRLSFLFSWKHDSGIVPFAFSHSLLASDLGALFFDPARKYARALEVPSPWAKSYTYNPYRPGETSARVVRVGARQGGVEPAEPEAEAALDPPLAGEQ